MMIKISFIYWANWIPAFAGMTVSPTCNKFVIPERFYRESMLNPFIFHDTRYV